MIQTLATDSPKILAFKLTGKLHDEDYKTFVPQVESALADTGGRVSMLAQFEDFHGWDLHAAWDDLKFGVRHFSDFDRIAVVGDKSWEQWMARFCNAFTKATVRYFDAAQLDSAKTWLKETA